MLPRKSVAIIKLEIHIPEVVRALEVFSVNRKLALEALSSEVRSAVSSVFNQLMSSEIELFLGAPEQSDNKRNGYQPEREYALKGIGCIRIRTPKDRKGRFESQVIPASERIDPRLKADMAVLHLAGLSTRILSMISRRLLGIEVSKDTISGSLDLITGEAEKWLARPITGRFWALYVDGTNFKVQRRGSTEREPSLVVLGISEDGHRSVLAIEPGTRDNVDSWRAVFRELKRRGLDPKAVRIGIMDGLPGLENLFRDEFPGAMTARCWVHAMRNALAKAPARLRDGFKLLADNVMYAGSEDAAREAFAALKATMGNDATRAVACLERDLDSLLVHYRFDSRFWKALKTTNAIERINKEFKRRTKSMETLGEATLKAVVTFVALRLEMGWQMHPVHSKALTNLPKKQQNAVEMAIDSMGILN
jgi:putative transposase